MLEDVGLTGWETLLALAGACGGAVVQGAIGFGYALVLVPILLFAAPATVPVAPMVIALPMVLGMVVRERHDVEIPTVARLTAGRIPGTALGAWVVAVVSVNTITALVGVALIATVALSALRPSVETTGPTQIVAGFASGVMGTVSALGGPVMGLALQSWPGPALRATLSVVFTLGLAMSLAALAIAGAVPADALVLGVLLAPATLAGLLVSRRLAARLDAGRLRVAVLTFAAAGGVAALARIVIAA